MYTYIHTCIHVIFVYLFLVISKRVHIDLLVCDCFGLPPLRPMLVTTLFSSYPCNLLCLVDPAVQSFSRGKRLRCSACFICCCVLCECFFCAVWCCDVLMCVVGCCCVMRCSSDLASESLVYKLTAPTQQQVYKSANWEHLLVNE